MAPVSAPRAAGASPVPRGDPAHTLGGMKPLIARVKRIVDWGMGTRPGRAFKLYSDSNGPLLAQGLSWQAIFATFAALWLAFAVMGFWLREDTPLRAALLEGLGSTIPGLIDTGDGGAVKLDDLLSVGVLGWTGAIAALSLAWTAVGWLSSGRSAVRAITGRPAATGNFFLLKLKDIGLTVVFGLAVLISASVSLGSTALLEAVFDWLGLDSAGPITEGVTRVVALVIAFCFDAAVLWLFYRADVGLDLPKHAVIEGSLLAAAGLGVLKALGGALLGGATSNPLLATFAGLVGLLIWFNLICQVILMGAAWIVVTGRPRRDVISEAGSHAASM